MTSAVIETTGLGSATGGGGHSPSARWRSLREWSSGLSDPTGVVELDSAYRARTVSSSPTSTAQGDPVGPTRCQAGENVRFF